MGEPIIDILKAVRDKKVKKLKKSIQAETYFNNKAVAIGENLSNSKKLGVTLQEHELKSTYYDMLSKYYHKSNFVFYKVNEKSVKFWRRVAECQNASGTNSNTYIKAQFFWFNKYFGTAPSLPHLITENAVKRAIEFSGCKGNVVSSSIPHQAELSFVLQQTDRMIRDIMKSQNLTKEEFYKKLVLTGEFPVSSEYLKVDPIYKKLIKC